jgi:Rhodopirellula transposase DDE domain
MVLVESTFLREEWWAWCLKEETMWIELTESMRETILSAAKKLTGFRRRQFQAEMAIKYCRSSPRQAERVFGWGREAVNTGLNELRSGIRCVEDYSTRGRPKSEEQNPELVQEIHALVEAKSQADPKFQTPLAYTRITAKAVRERLMANTAGDERHVPAERTVHDILNRLGYRLRRVQKTKPQKKSRKPTPSSTTYDKCTRRLPKPLKRSASHSTPRPR